MPPMPPRRILATATAVVAVVAAYLMLAPDRQNNPNDAPGANHSALSVEAVRVTPEPLVVTLGTVGTLRSNESVVLRPEVAGRVETIHFTEGAPVKKDDILIALDARLVQSELQQAQAQLELARVSLKRAQQLKSSGAVAQSRLDQTSADYAVAEANTNLARTRLDKTRIRAPFDGVVGLRHVSPGDYVNVGQEMASFESFHPLKVDFSIPEIYAPRLQTGQSIEINIDAFPGRVFTGTVYALDPQIDAGGRNVALRAALPNPDLSLKPGYFARVNLTVENKENALLVPESALMPRGTEAFVYVVDGGKAVLRKVETGLRREGRVEIVSGLQPGDVVVTAGQMKLREGVAVTAQIAGEAPPGGASPASAAEN